MSRMPKDDLTMLRLLLRTEHEHAASLEARSGEGSKSGEEGVRTWNVMVRHDFDKIPLDPGTAVNMLEGDLCAQCGRIDFKAIFELQASEVDIMGTKICKFRGLNPAMVEAKCQLCRALATLLSSDNSDHIGRGNLCGELLALPASSISGVRNQFGQNLPIVCGVALESKTPTWDALLRCVSGLQALILPEERSSHLLTTFCHGVGLRTLVNPARVREMLSRCAKTHIQCRKPSHDFPAKARVIDCNTHCLVPMSKSCRYLALSYVWGASNTYPTSSQAVGGLLTEEPLSLPLPRTIEDAITMTKSLGLRYLWVDKYCIQQYHSADKQYQISQMASIYNCALATLCALGSHGNAGLPGITKRRASHEEFRSQGESLILSPAMSLQQSLQHSAWSTRGWTFQEALLSRRCVFFTPQEVHLVCCESSQRESISQCTGFIDTQKWGSSTTISSMVLEQELRWSTDDRLKFPDYVQHYQKRHFTMDSDALPAFKGILSVMSNASYYGVVVYHVGTAQRHTSPYFLRVGFIHGLLWEVEQHMTYGNNLRSSTPSWSWLARKYALPRFVTLNLNNSTAASETGLACVSGVPHTDTFVAQISVPDSSGSDVDIGLYLQRFEDKRVIPENSPYLVISSLLVSFRFTEIISTRRKSFRLGDLVLSNSSERSHLGNLVLDEAKHLPRVREPNTEEGIAILLLGGGYRSGPAWYYLVIQPTEDGAYRRIGMLSHNLPKGWPRTFPELLPLHEGKFTTIRLK